MNESVTLILPLPPAVLSPNALAGSFGGRMKKMRASAAYRKKARTAALQAQIETGPWKCAKVTAHFYHKTNRRRDDVNHLAMLKAAYDGIVDAGILEDDDNKRLQTQTPTFAMDREHPRVELFLERLL